MIKWLNKRHDRLHIRYLCDMGYFADAKFEEELFENTYGEPSGEYRDS